MCIKLQNIGKIILGGGGGGGGGGGDGNVSGIQEYQDYVTNLQQKQVNLAIKKQQALKASFYY